MSSSIAGVVLYSVALLARAPEVATPGVPSAPPSGPAHLIKDVNASPDVGGRSARFEDMIRVGDLAYVRAFTPSTGTEIWRTDGTPGGTFIPKEVPGLVGTPEIWWESAGILYYSVHTGEGFDDLWRSDGTNSGTRKVKRFADGQYVYHPLALHQEQSLFQLYDVYAETFALWRTDGTEAGTVFVTDMSYFLGDGVWLDGAAYLPDIFGLRKTDGTAAGTGSVPGVCGSVDNLVTMNGRLYYVASDCESGFGVYSTDGTEAGTELLTIFASRPSGLADVGGVLYWTYGNDIWKSDGSPEGTVAVVYLDSYAQPTGFVGAGGVVLFTAYGEGGRELWKTDGTAEGTALVKDIWPGSRNSFISPMTSAGGVAYFTAADGVHGNELWRSDGTTAGTVLVKDIWPGPQGQQSVRGMVDLGGTVLFPAADPTFGWELWKTDGTESGTVLLRDMNPVAATKNSLAGSAPLRMGRNLYFGADDGVHGSALWKTDGTPAGTMLVKSFALPPQLWTDHDGRIVFEAMDGAGEYAVWKSDGTEARTVPVTDFHPDPGSSYPRFAGVLGGAVYFTASDGSQRSLWKTDLTETVLVSQGLDACGYDPLVVNGVLYFAGDDGVHGCELWKIDATTGAQMVKNIRPDDETLYPPAAFLDIDGKLLFLIEDVEHGLEPWTSDGTEEGTYLVKDVYPGPYGSIWWFPVSSGGKVYFSGYDESNGVEMWVTDGTEEGTHIFADLMPGPDSLWPDKLLDLDGRLMFVSLDPETGGDELWSSNGTEAGTQVFQEDLRVAETPTAIDGVAFFASDNPGAEVGFGLWRSDGTAAGTASVQVIDRFSYASDNGQTKLTGFTKVGHRIVFFADDGVTGMEPWTGWASVLENRPAQAIADLRDEVTELNLPADASRVLLASLGTAARALRGGNSYAIPWLETFVQQVNAQTPQWIAPEAGAELIDFAQGIIGLLQPRPEPPVD